MLTIILPNQQTKQTSQLAKAQSPVDEQADNILPLSGLLRASSAPSTTCHVHYNLHGDEKRADFLKRCQLEWRRRSGIRETLGTERGEENPTGPPEEFQRRSPRPRQRPTSHSLSMPLTAQKNSNSPGRHLIEFAKSLDPSPQSRLEFQDCDVLLGQIATLAYQRKSVKWF